MAKQNRRTDEAQSRSAENLARREKARRQEPAPAPRKENGAGSVKAPKALLITALVCLLMGLCLILAGTVQQALTRTAAPVQDPAPGLSAGTGAVQPAPPAEGPAGAASLPADGGASSAAASDDGIEAGAGSEPAQIEQGTEQGTEETDPAGSISAQAAKKKNNRAPSATTPPIAGQNPAESEAGGKETAVPAASEPQGGTADGEPSPTEVAAESEPAASSAAEEDPASPTTAPDNEQQALAPATDPEGGQDPAFGDGIEAPPAAQTPEQQPARVQKQGLGIGQILVIIGLVLVLVGCVLFFAAAMKILSLAARLAERQAVLRARMKKLEEHIADPTKAEKLKYAFEQIPVLTSAEAEPQAPAPMPAQPPVQQVPVQPAAPQMSAQEIADQAFCQLLQLGAQGATQQLLTSPEEQYRGANIDIQNSLNAYQGGQEVPYQLRLAAKDWNAQYFLALPQSTTPVLYPNPYLLEQKGLPALQQRQFICKVFDILYRSTPLTPQTIASAASGRLVRVQGAQVDARGIVVQKGILFLE